ncbi:MAG: HAMP domain-containing histidine kinase [Acetatifactor sp.]|nr:HAMP domain-containing histidine kinase [Acetatifactor sp.]
MRENQKMSSIARSINFSFWRKRLTLLLCVDMLLFVMVAITFAYWRGQLLPEDAIVKKIEITGDGYRNWEYIQLLEDGSYISYKLYEFLKYLVPSFLVLLAFEFIDIFSAMFNTAEIRRRLKPLNDLATKAEQISSLDASHFENLREAISQVSPSQTDLRISTGDKDLQSIEVALNNLLARIQESQKQQNRFISDASHELRTPIAVIQGYVNMLDRWGKDDESVLEESIEALKNESEHMKELVEQLLFLARGDSGRNTLKKTQMDLRDLMQEVYDESVMIDEKHTYKLELDDKEAPLFGDLAMLKQSIRIFVQNAAKYSPEKNTIRLAVKATETSVSYMVQDEGIGIVEEQISHIFERFYRADETRGGSAEGSGLGLSIAKWIVDAHDGTIDVLSRPDIGTRFTITFHRG